jgi:hypothetical protein
MSNPAHGSSKKKASKGTRTLKFGSAKDVVEPCSWSEVNPEALQATVTQLTLAQGAIMFTRSGDGGVLGIRVYHDDVQTETIWARPDEMDSILFEIHETFKEGYNNGE